MCVLMKKSKRITGTEVIELNIENHKFVFVRLSARFRDSVMSENNFCLYVAFRCLFLFVCLRTRETSRCFTR